MNIYLIIIAILLLLVLALIIRLLLIKANIRQMKRELIATRQEGYNRQLRIALSDRDAEDLAAEINRNLDYQKDLKSSEEQSRKRLEQSVSDIAHDLRTPLTVINGNLQMLENEELSDKGRNYLMISSRKAAELKGMVDEFFELSVMESDTGPVETEELDAVRFLTDFLLEHETVIRDKGFEPEINLPDKAILISANRDLLGRVIGNILSNILKYATSSFVLSVYTEKDEACGNEKCVIRFGNRIGEDSRDLDIEHIFDRTYRGDKARSKGGAGLGLYIAKMLAEKQGASLCAELSGDMIYFVLRMAVKS